MTEAKHISKKLMGLLDNEIIQGIMDRSQPLDPIMKTVNDWWGFDLYSRSPRPAYDEYGTFQGTNLDLACFLYELAGRGAVINIPFYESHSVTTQRKDQVLKSTENRNGELVNVLSNQDFFSFNIKVIDQNVIGEESVGDFRTFSLTEKDGTWYKGWKSIQFEPTLKENRFLTENKLWSGNKILFNHFIHPNRWTSFFGFHYLATKLLIERLTDESAFYNSEVKRLVADGIKFPEGATTKNYEYYPKGKGVSKKFVGFHSKIYMPKSQIQGDYPMLESTQDELVRAYANTKVFRALKARLQFMTRATEYAHYINPNAFPAWIKNVKWEDDFIEPGKRTKWQRLKIIQPSVGEHSVSILKRTFVKSAMVKA